MILHRTQGHFSYTLDDPYIHLALAERLAHGHYGLNAGELTTPSSSILWPFLLTLGAGTAWHPYLPLAYNLVFGSITAWLMGLMARRWEWLREVRYPGSLCWVFSALLVIAANLPGLTFTGMEHVLQVLTAVVCAYGAMSAFHERRIPWWCVATVVLAPSVRYESYVLCLALAVALYAQRRRWAAVAVMSISLVPPVLFAWFLVRQGHPPLPNSVLVKGAAFATHQGMAANLLTTMRTNALAYITSPKRWTFTIVVPLLAWAFWRERKDRLHRTVLAGVIVAIGLQMVAGAYSWFHRYEVFAKILAVLTLIAVASAFRRKNFAWVATAVLLVADLPYISAIRLTPLAAQNIEYQQYEMHRFVQQYDGNFAVNDLGWVSYQLPPSTYVLDLVGLASLETMQRVDKTPEWLDDVTRRHGCGLVIIYAQWFPNVPDDWVRVARLSFRETAITATQKEVYFYETPFGTSRDREVLAAELESFGRDLPSGVELRLHPPPATITSGDRQVR